MSESSRAFQLDTPSSSSATGDADRHRHGKPASAMTTGGDSVPFHRLFAFADGADAALMSLGTIGALANGAAMPLMTVLFARLIDAFGGAADTRDVVVARVSAVSLQFLYLAVASFVQVACWMITGERQAARIRSLYLRAILRQEVAFFDQRATTGEVVGRMSGDTVLIQDAMGEKVGKCVQLLVAFAGGFAVAFAQGCLLD